MPLRLLVLGGGNRGLAYARLAVSLGARIVGVADPRPERREALARAFGVERVFADWREAVEAPPMGEGAV
ncbi:NAD(P)-binding domain-containing protein, partial [Thermus sp.]|nr:gfo/Idh/MocA family oxidoreductase [Thermus sp.]